MEIDISSKNSTTMIANVVFWSPFAVLELPYFKDGKKIIGSKPKPIVFWTKEECEKALKRLPKDWLIHFLTSRR